MANNSTIHQIPTNVQQGKDMPHNLSFVYLDHGVGDSSPASADNTIIPILDDSHKPSFVYLDHDIDGSCPASADYDKGNDDNIAEDTDKNTYWGIDEQKDSEEDNDETQESLFPNTALRLKSTTRAQLTGNGCLFCLPNELLNMIRHELLPESR